MSSVLAILAACIQLAIFIRGKPAAQDDAKKPSVAGGVGLTEAGGTRAATATFHDLFLAIGVLVGVALLNIGGSARLDITNPNNYVEKNGAYGTAVVCFGLLCMLAESVALVAFKRATVRSGIVRGLCPAAGLLAVALLASDLSGI